MFLTPAAPADIRSLFCPANIVLIAVATKDFNPFFSATRLYASPFRSDSPKYCRLCHQAVHSARDSNTSTPHCPPPPMPRPAYFSKSFPFPPSAAGVFHLIFFRPRFPDLFPPPVTPPLSSLRLLRPLLGNLGLAVRQLFLIAHHPPCHASRARRGTAPDRLHTTPLDLPPPPAHEDFS